MKLAPSQNCGKCGLCLTTCPVYKTLKEEQASPRARLQLIKAFENKTLESSALLREIISKCLMCGACAVTCPSGINHYSKFMEMRQKMVADLGETPAIKSLIFLLSRESRIRKGASLAKWGQKLTPAWLANKYQLGNIPIKQLPRFNSLPFRQTLDRIIPPQEDKKGTLVYFTGCATQFLYEDTGRSVVGVLTHLGYEVVIPQDQTCCGLPLMFHGAQTQAVENMTANINSLAAQECDGILVDCTTCGAALKHEYPALIEKLKDQAGPDKTKSWEDLGIHARKIADKTMDILSFLSDKDLDLKKNMENLGPVAYHAPCHSRNSFNSHTRVQNLLGKLAFIQYTPSPDEAECCGGGGTFFYEHPDVAGQIMAKKIQEIQRLQPKYWVTDCPVCRINLAGNLDPTSQIQVIHPITLIHGAVKPHGD